jgi:aspartyl-tRNA(Asn)/glutamyl-tRNA(Gln) amidotransferase subunit B
MNNFEVVIGIENHIELKTKTKMFAPAPVSFGSEPNTQISSVDLGYPGALPTVNREGVRLALLACNALNMKIEPLLRFDRKNYFYPDLVKGFQITQNYHPIGSNGTLKATMPNGEVKEFTIERLHIEEDTAKQNHIGETTYLDYNRSGIGLIEVVSNPVMRSADDAVAYVDHLREIVLFLGVSDAKMNEGSLRCDVNISLRPYGAKEFGNKVEIKNLNSLNNVRKAIEFEIKRQSKMLLNGEVVDQETRRFDEATQETILMRKKSSAVDYRYFREPNIHPIQLDAKWIDDVLKNSPELAETKRTRYLEKFKLDMKEVNYLLSDLTLVDFFERTLVLINEPKKIANLIISDIQSLVNATNTPLNESKLTVENFAALIQKMNDGVISSKHVKIILPIIFEKDVNVDQIIEEQNLKLISDRDTIEKLLLPIVEQNHDLIKTQYENRPERVEKQMMGQLMKVTGGNVNPEVGMDVIVTLIKKVK